VIWVIHVIVVICNQEALQSFHSAQFCRSRLAIWCFQSL